METVVTTSVLPKQDLEVLVMNYDFLLNLWNGSYIIQNNVTRLGKHMANCIFLQSCITQANDAIHKVPIAHDTSNNPANSGRNLATDISTIRTNDEDCRPCKDLLVV